MGWGGGGWYTDYSGGDVCTLPSMSSKTGAFPTILKRNAEAMVVKATMKRCQKRQRKRKALRWERGSAGLRSALLHTSALPSLRLQLVRTGSASGMEVGGEEGRA